MDRPVVGWRVWLFFAAVTLVATYPLPLQFTTHLLGTGPDPNLYMWTLGWNAYAFLHQPFAIFDANIFHPARHTLAYSENLIGDALLVAPWLWATGDLVGASNLVQIASVYLSAVGAFLLARRLGLPVLPAILAGLVFGFTPARLLRMPQVHVTSIHWMPWCLAYLHTYFSPHGKRRDLRLAIGFFALQALASGHGAVFLVVAVVVVLACQWAAGEPLAILKRVRHAGWPGFLALAVAGACVLPYRAARAEVGNLARTYEETGLTFSSYLSSPSRVHDWLWQYWPSSWTSPPPEASLFPGFVAGALALLALVVARQVRPATAHDSARTTNGFRNGFRNPVVIYGIMLFVAVWFVIGPPYGLWRWTYSWPIFGFMRVPTRFVLLLILALGVLAGFGAHWLGRRAGTTGRWLLVAAIALFGVESLAAPLSTERVTIEVPSADRWLASRPRPFAIAEVPVADSLLHDTQAVWETRYMLHATAHWQPTVHGYSGVDPAAHHALIRALITFPDAHSLEELRRRNVRYVVMHPRLYEPAELAKAEARLVAFRHALKLEYSSRDGRVYSLVP